MLRTSKVFLFFIFIFIVSAFLVSADAPNLINGNQNRPSLDSADISNKTFNVNITQNITNINQFDQSLNTTDSVQFDNLTLTGNITLGQKITFAFGEMIDNIRDGWIRVTGSLNVTDQLNVMNESTFGDSVNIVAGVPTLIFDDTHMGHDKYRIRIEDDNLVIGAGSPIIDFFTIMANGMNSIVLDNADVNITQNLTVGERIIQNNYSIYPVILNDDVIDSAFCLEMNSPDGDRHCKLVIQPGGDGQASIIRRSFSIVNDEACSGVNATNMQCYADVGGFTWNIDFNTSLSGADVGIADDLEVIGEIWLRNSAGQPKFLTRTLDLLDETFENILFNDADLNIVSGVLNINDTLNETLVVNLNRTETITDSISDSITLNTGTNITPAINHISYQNPANPTLTIGTTEATVPHAEVVVIYSGSDENIYLFENTISHNEQVIDQIYDRFGEEGGLYISGLTQTASTTQLNFTTGTVRLRLNKKTYTNNLVSDDGFFYINSTNHFVQCTDNTCLDKYTDDTTISNNRYYTIVWGVVPIDNNQQKLMALLQGNPNSEYISAIAAEEDTLGKANFFPSNVDFKEAFIPVARTIHRRTGNNDFVTFPTTGELFQDLRGKATVGSGGVPSPPLTEHNLLDNLEWANASHLFNLVGQFFNIGSYNLTTTGNVTADFFFGDGSQLTGISTTQTKVNNLTCTGDDKFSAYDNVTGNFVCSTDQTTAGGLQNSTSWNRTGTNVSLANTGDNVGIGTTTPSKKLVVNEDLGDFATAQLVVGDGSDTLAGMVLGLDEDNGLLIRFVNSIRAEFWTKEAGTFYQTLNLDGGKVGINVTAPVVALDVFGDSLFTGNLNITDTLILESQLTPTTNIEGGVFYNSSLQSLMAYNGTDWLGLTGVPEGAIMGFDGTCPSGWTETSSSLISEKEHADAWVNFNNTPTILDSFNVDSVTDTGSGEWTITWDKDFADTNYVLSFMVDGGNSGFAAEIVSLSVGSAEIRTFRTNDNVAAETPTLVTILAFGNNSNTLKYCQKVGQDSQESETFWGKVGNILFSQNSSLSVLIENFLNVTHKIIAVNLTITGNPSGTPEADTLYAKSLPKGWVNFDGATCSGTCTIRDSFNVANVTRVGVGNYQIFWDRDFAAVNYAITGGAGGDTFASFQENLVGSVRETLFDVGTHGLVDRDQVYAVVFGEQ